MSGAARNPADAAPAPALASPEAELYRDAGDAARDAARWSDAAAAYAIYLSARPDDAGILVQHGHAVKESGDPDAALVSYRRAAALAPADPDIPLQIGHALKLSGREAAALDAYATALALAPGADDPWREWLALAPRATPPRRAAGTVLDLSDLLAWHAGRRQPTGIQRVQWEILAALPPGEVAACAMPRDGTGWRALPLAALLRLRHLSRHAAAPWAVAAWEDAWRALRDWIARAPDLRFAPGALLLNPGTAWAFPAMANALRAAREDGLRHVPLIHDCGPVSVPGNSRARAFARWFETLPALADGIIAVSEATAAEIHAVAARHLPDEAFPPVAVVPMDGLTRLPDSPAAPPPEEPPEGPYVLLVASLEPRKGHALAFEAWRQLITRRGAEAVPRLLCVGRRADGDAAALAMLEADPALAARVTLLHDADDAALDRLYAGCLFTLYPSSHEGWGLPVSEALAHGKVPVAAGHSAMLQSGAGVARFFTPGRADSLAAIVESLLAPDVRREAEALIPPGGGLRPWSDVAASILDAARRLAAAPPRPDPAPLPLARPIPLAGPIAPRPDPAGTRAARLPEGEGWGSATDEGLPAGPGATLRLPVAEEGPLRLHLALGRHEATRVFLSREGAATADQRLDPGGPTHVALEIGPGAPLLRVAFDTRAALVRSVAILRAGNPADRVALLEARWLLPVEPLSAEPA